MKNNNMEKNWPKELSNHITHRITLIGQKEGFLITSSKLKLSQNDITKEILCSIVKPPKKIIIKASIEIERYRMIPEKGSFIETFYPKEENEKIKKLGIKKNILNKILWDFFKIKIGKSQYYHRYFIFSSEKEIKGFFPLSYSIPYLNSYYVYLPEKENNLKQMLLSNAPIKNILELCYAIIPGESCSGSLELDIFSNEMDISDLKVLVEKTFDSYQVRDLTEKEKQIFIDIVGFDKLNKL